MKPNEHFNQGVQEALKEAQKRANEEGRSIRVGSVWVNPSSAALSKRPKNPDEGVPPLFMR
jgi:hypothetical protein